MASCPQRKFRFSSSTWSCLPASWPLASSGCPSSARTRNALALGGPPLPSSPPPIPVPDGAPAPASVPNPPARYNVFKIHWLMAALAFTKSVSLLLHSVSAWVWSREVRLGPRGQGSSAEQPAPHVSADASPGRSARPPLCPSVLLLWPAVHPLRPSACPWVPL